MRIIRTTADLEEGAAYLAKAEPRFAQALKQSAKPPLRLRPGGFAALMRILAEQQVSVASGRAIWARLEAGGATNAHAVLEASQEDLRALGLSKPKARYAHAIAAAVKEGALDFERLSKASDKDAMKELTAITGVGLWSAQVYLMFCEGRADLFPSRDVALQEAARALFQHDARPTEKRLDEMAQNWSPWRAVAARILWEYYRFIKGREGAT